jgi:hypothetical protein
MIYLFDGLVVVGLLGIFVSPRKPDLIDLSFAGLLIFSLPLIFGRIVRPDDFELLPVHPGSYAVMVIPLATLVGAILIRAMMWQRERSRDAAFEPTTWTPNKTVFRVAFAFLVYIMLRDLLDVRHLEELLSKKQMNLLTSGAGSLFFINTLIAFCMAWAGFTRKYFPMILIFCIALIQATIFQSRSAFLFVIIVLAVTYIRQSKLSGLKLKILMAVPTFFALAITVVYKTIKGRLLRGMWDRIPPITDAEFWTDVFNHFEPNKAMFLLNGVVSEGVEFGVEHVFSSIARAIPFSQTLFSMSVEKWGRFVQYQIFGEHPGGFANNIWAEVFSFGGLGSVFVWSMLWFAGIIVLQKSIADRRLLVRCFGLTLVPHWCFFMLRVSLGSTLSYVMNAFLLIAGVTIIGLIIGSTLSRLKMAYKGQQSQHRMRGTLMPESTMEETKNQR